MKKIKICVLMACLMMCVSSFSLAANFYDVKGTKYEGVVDRVAQLGIINGISETTFAPYKSITRAELAKMIVFTRGLQDYADTAGLKANFFDTKGHWAESYIAAAEDLGILNGYNDGSFKPDAEVSYAEVVAIILRGLGYVNIDETSGTTWYSGYIKRMFEIDLGKGVDVYKSYEAPARRGDVAILWWNMLVSKKWVIESSTDGTGPYYTYSDKTQLDVLFPDFYVVTGRVTSIFNPDSGDKIGVRINSKEYTTASEVPIYSKGAMALGVCDKSSNELYGFTIDEDLEDYKIVSGPTFYLKEQGYNLNKSENEAVYGLKSKANFVYLLVSRESGKILRSVFIDASNSSYVDSIKVIKKNENEGEKKSVETPLSVYLNGSETPFISNADNAIVIKNGKKVDWKEIGEGSVLTELIPGELYAYEDNVLQGDITDYSNFKEELSVNHDKYIISGNCYYSVFGDNVDDEKKALRVLLYSKSMTVNKLKSLLARDVEFYFNIAEEICFIKFGKYLSTNFVEKYDNIDYSFFYITSLTYSSGDDTMNVGGYSLNRRHLKYYLPPSDDFEVGDFVMVSGIDGKEAKNIELIDSDVLYEEYDISVIYDCQDELYNNAFGEYNLVDDTVVFRINKYYKDNSNDEVEKYTITELSSIYQVEDLEKCKINLLCNNDMEIDIIFLERELNKTTYPVGRVVEVKKIKTLEDEKYVSKDNIPLVHVKITTIGGGSDTYELLSGECALGELVTYELKEDNVKIKERFHLKFLGYENDVVIESFDRRNKIAEVKGNSEDLDLLGTTFNFKGKEFDLLDYKYLLSDVRVDYETGEWKFTNGEFYQKEDLILKPGDRIAFGELNGIAIIYRGWTY